VRIRRVVGEMAKERIDSNGVEVGKKKRNKSTTASQDCSGCCSRFSIRTLMPGFLPVQCPYCDLIQPRDYVKPL